MARGRWESDWVALEPLKTPRIGPYISPNLDFSELEIGTFFSAARELQGLPRACPLAQSGTPRSPARLGKTTVPAATAGAELCARRCSDSAALAALLSSIRPEYRAASEYRPPLRPRRHMSAWPEPRRSSHCLEAAQVRETRAWQLPVRTPDSQGKQPKTPGAVIDPERARVSLVNLPGGKCTYSA